MAETSRVDDLRKRYHENPRRFFAPLANEYRKTGFLDRALLLCEKHLGEQPGNMNGLIVYGQTLFESGRHADARGPFEAALELDPENLIALRHLGDIARLGEDHEEARRWYGRVLEFDRRNEEVRALFAQVGGGIAEPGSGPSIRRSETTPRDAAFHSAKTVEVTPRPLAEAKTLEITPPSIEPLSEPLSEPLIEPLSEPMLAPSAESASAPTPEPASAPQAGLTPGGFTSADALDLVLDDEFGTEPSSAGVAEVSSAPLAPAEPPRPRASLLDINFDFGETANADAPSAPTPALPLLGSEAAEYGFAHGLPTLDAPEPSALDESEPLALDEPELPALDEPEPVALDEPEPPAPRRSEPLFEPPPEPISLTNEVTAVEGLQLAEFNADVEPLADLEPGEFEGESDHIAPLAGLEPVEFIASEPESPLAPTPAAGIPTFVTETMAKLYLEQGFRAEAIEVYRTLVAQDPADTAMQQTLQDLEAASRVSVEFEAPSAPEPADNAMLADVSFADVSLDTPSSAPRIPTPLASPRVPTPAAPPAVVGPSAREFFATFVHRAAVADPHAHAADPYTYSGESYAIPPALSSLDGMFGVEVNQDDQRAANQLSGVGTTTAPSGTSSLDTLFGAETPATLRPRGDTPRASEKLKFDQFFTSTSTPRPVTPVAPAAEPSSAAEPATGESLTGEPPTGESLPADGDDDLDQFQGWLKGLTS